MGGRKRRFVYRAAISEFELIGVMGVSPTGRLLRRWPPFVPVADGRPKGRILRARAHALATTTSTTFHCHDGHDDDDVNRKKPKEVGGKLA